MAEEQLRLQAIVVDGFTGPLAKLRRDLQGVTVAGNSSLKAMQLDWRRVSTEIGRVSDGISRTLVPVMSRLGMTSLGVGGGFGVALGAILAGVKSLGAGHQDLRLFAGSVQMSVDSVRAFEKVGERFGVAGQSMRQALSSFVPNAIQLKKNMGASLLALRELQADHIAQSIAAAKTAEEAFTIAMEEIGKLPDADKRRKVTAALGLPPEFAEIAREEVGKFRGSVAEMKRLQGGEIPKGLDEAAEQFNKNWSRMAANLDRIRINSLGPALRVLNDLLDTAGRAHGALMLDKTPAELILGARGAAADAEAKIRAKREARDIIDQKIEGATGMARDRLEAQRDRLSKELRDLTDALRKLREGGATVQPQSFMGGGFAGLIHKAGLSGFGGMGGGGFGSGSFGRSYDGMGDVPAAASGPGGLDGTGRGRGGAASAGGAAGGLGGAFQQYSEGNPFFDAIIRAEGTGGRHLQTKPYLKGSPYNAVLGHGAYGLPPKPITEMTLAEAYAFGRQVRARHGASSALGAFQIVGRTMKDFMAKAGLGWNDQFSPENQRKLAAVIAERQGLGAWEGFRGHPRERARAADAMRGGVHRQTATAGGAVQRSGRLGFGDVDWNDPAGKRPGDAMMGRVGALGAGAGPKVDVNAPVNIHLAPGLENLRARVSVDDMVRPVNLQRGRAMAAADGHEDR